MIDSPARKAYEGAKDFARNAADEAKRAADKTYNDKLTALRNEYEEKTGTARQTYLEEIDALELLYNEAISEARKVCYVAEEEYKQAEAARKAQLDAAMLPDDVDR